MHQEFDQVVISRLRSGARALLVLGAVMATAPASAGETYSRYKLDSLHKWTISKWTIWAMPGHVCLAMEQEIDFAKPSFWGFMIKDGLDSEMFFGSIADAQPQTVQITFNYGKPVSFPARVQPMDGANAYVIPFDLEYVWTLQDDVDIDVFTGGNRVFSGGTKVMGKIAEGLEKCDDWNQAHSPA